jgi:hypothetical protein
MREATMVTIRLAKREWGKAWRAMIEVAAVRLIQDDPVYEVLPAHLGVLAARGFAYEAARVRPRRGAARGTVYGMACLARGMRGDGLPKP